MVGDGKDISSGPVLYHRTMAPKCFRLTWEALQIKMEKIHFGLTFRIFKDWDPKYITWKCFLGNNLLSQDMKYVLTVTVTVEKKKI